MLARAAWFGSDVGLLSWWNNLSRLDEVLLGCRMPRQSLSRAPELHVASSHETWNSLTCGFSNLTKGWKGVEMEELLPTGSRSFGVKRRSIGVKRERLWLVYRKRFPGGV
ncbi:hypothetical protein H0E87_000870 [Populus deltoides]|uniref:Uncharacterized protein n=1 Tax=Populus deltoides TaxID=3696 RepID=A0A8T2ZR43_POPDE|nr:hypothetical protein H0E87_000870 [Populus deltoides]